MIDFTVKHVCYYTPTQYAQINGLHVQDVLARIKDGTLPYFVDDDGIRIKVEYPVKL